MFREPWRTHARELLRRESDVLRMLSGGAVPVATLIAVDERAEATDHPALLMTHLPGRLRLDAPATSAALADMLVRIHQVQPTTRPRVYQSWAVPERQVIPAWSECPEVWERAFAARHRMWPSIACGIGSSHAAVRDRTARDSSARSCGSHGMSRPQSL